MQAGQRPRPGTRNGYKRARSKRRRTGQPAARDLRGSRRSPAIAKAVVARVLDCRGQRRKVIDRTSKNRAVFPAAPPAPASVSAYARFAPEFPLLAGLFFADRIHSVADAESMPRFPIDRFSRAPRRCELEMSCDSIEIVAVLPRCTCFFDSGGVDPRSQGLEACAANAYPCSRAPRSNKKIVVKGSGVKFLLPVHSHYYRLTTPRFFSGRDARQTPSEVVDARRRWRVRHDRATRGWCESVAALRAKISASARE